MLCLLEAALGCARRCQQAAGVSLSAGCFALLGLILLSSCAVVSDCSDTDSRFFSPALFCELCAFSEWISKLV